MYVSESFPETSRDSTLKNQQKFCSILANGHIRWCTERSLAISEVKHDRDMSELGWVAAQPCFYTQNPPFSKSLDPMTC